MDWCGTPLSNLQLVVVKIYGPSPGLSNSVVTLRVEDSVLKPQVASQQPQQNEMDNVDVVVAIQYT